MFLVTHGNPQNKVHNDGCEQRDGKYGRAEAIIEAALTPLPDALRAPMKGKEGIHHSHHSNEGEQASANLTDPIAKVE